MNDVWEYDPKGCGFKITALGREVVHSYEVTLSYEWRQVSFIQVTYIVRQRLFCD